MGAEQAWLSAVDSARPYVPRLAAEWLTHTPDERARIITGSLAFVDISGFTKLTERLARRGNVGAEELSDILDETFGALVREAYLDGADLVKWGGDAILLLFRGSRHAQRAVHASAAMRSTLRTVGRTQASAGSVQLRMSVGINSGDFHFFLVGDDAIHRELIISGPGASTCARMEAIATAGQIVVSDTTAALLPPATLGERVEGGYVIRRAVDDDVPVRDDDLLPAQPGSLDLTRLISPLIREHILSGRLASEHRPIAVAFVQWSGTDALIADRGLSAATDAIDEVVRNIQRGCQLHSVSFHETDINADGGKAMLVCGAPRTFGNDEERLLRAVRTILDSNGFLALRAGINRGAVFTGGFGPPQRRTYSCKGDAINLAARVMARATPGQILATREVMARSRTLFVTDELEPFLVKGKSLPVHAVSVGPVLERQAEEGTGGDFVGREQELAVIEAALRQARDGSGSVLTILGEPGIGKSRLAFEARRRAHDVRVITGVCGTYESETAFYPFRALLREAMGIAGATDPEVITRLTSLVRERTPELEAWLPLLGVVLDVDLPATAETSELDEQFRKGRLEEVVLDFLDVVLDSPTLVMIENAHLMDVASAELLRHIERGIATRGWVLLVSRRDVASGFVPMHDEPAHVLLHLEPLDTREAVALLEAATKDAPLGPAAMSAVAARAGGNPLFLRALVVAAGQSGGIAALPDSIESVVAREVDQLDPDDRTALRLAAVLGVSFSLSTLRALVEEHGTTIDAAMLSRVSALVAADGADLCHFRHAVIQEAAYAGLPYRLRRQLHEQVGLLLERDRVGDENIETLSRHFFHSGNWERAWHYSRVAGDVARAKYAYVDAITFYERALEAAHRLGTVSSAELITVCEALGDVQIVAGMSDAAVDAFRTARMHAVGDVVTAGHLTWKEAQLHLRAGRLSQALRILSRARHAMSDQQGVQADAVRSQLAIRYGYTRYTQSRLKDALHWCHVGEQEAERSGSIEARAYAYNVLHIAHMFSGTPSDRPYGQMALAMFEELGDLSGQANCLNNLGGGAYMDGRWEDSLELTRRGAILFRRIGDAASEAAVVSNIVEILVRQGRHSDARDLLPEALRWARSAGDRQTFALLRREFGRASAGLGDPEGGIIALDEARAIFVELGLTREALTVDAAIAECLVQTGRGEAALDLVQLAIQRAATPQCLALMPMLRRVLATALVACNQQARAVAELRDVLAQRASIEDPDEVASVLALLAWLGARSGVAQAARYDTEQRDIRAALGVVAAPACERAVTSAPDSEPADGFPDGRQPPSPRKSLSVST